MKKLSTDNWREMDPTCDAFLYLDHETGKAGPLFPDQWANLLLALDLDHRVPENIKQLFDVARAAMLYGHYYYPLFQLGVDQMHRVAEAAISEKNRMCGGPESTKNGGFVGLWTKIKWLYTNSHIDKAQKDEWEWVKKMRNSGSHLRDVDIYPPVPSMSHVEETILRIDRLFI